MLSLGGRGIGVNLALTYNCRVWNKDTDPNTGATGSIGGGETVADLFQTNLIMPEPTPFLDSKFGPVAIIRPTCEAGGGGAVSAVKSFVDDGLFLDPASNKNTGIVAVLMKLAEAADDARRR